MSPELHLGAGLSDGSHRKGLTMPQMFDWIFFAIVLIPMALLVWDWARNR